MVIYQIEQTANKQAIARIFYVHKEKKRDLIASRTAFNFHHDSKCRWKKTFEVINV